MEKETLDILNKSNVIYHNLQLIRHSVNELDYLLNHPLDSVLFGFIGYPPYYFTNLIDIHGRNVVVLLATLFEGDTSLEKMINYFQANLNKIDLKNKAIQPTNIEKIIVDSQKEYEKLKKQYFPIVKTNRDKIAAHQDNINTKKPSELAGSILTLDSMKILLPKLEQIFARFYYSLTNEEYIVYDPKSFVDEGLHSLYADKMKTLE